MKKRNLMAICYCNFCRGAVQFQAARAGETINCPECTMETVLYIPDATLPYPSEKYLLEAHGIAWKTSTLGIRQLAGTVINKSSNDLDWVRIEFVLYDNSEYPIGSASDCLIHFSAGGEWTFQAPVFLKEAVFASTPVVSCEFGKIHQVKRVNSSPEANQLAAR